MCMCACACVYVCICVCLCGRVIFVVVLVCLFVGVLMTLSIHFSKQIYLDQMYGYKKNTMLIEGHQTDIVTAMCLLNA